MVDIVYVKATRCKEIHGDDRISNQLSHGNTVGAEINSAHEKHLPAPCLNDYSASVATHCAIGRGNSGGSNICHTEEVDAMSSAPTPARLKFTDTYWVIPIHSDTPYGKVSFTRQEARFFRVMFKDSRLIWAGRQPVHQGVEEISIPQGRVNITPPLTITNIVTVQVVAHV